MPSDNDYYRVVAQTTGTLDFQVYFKLFTRRCCRPAAISTLEVLRRGRQRHRRRRPGDIRHGRRHGQRPRPHPGGGRAELLPARLRPTADGTANAAVVNGYDVTIIDTPNPVPSNLELSRSVPAPVAGNPDTGDLPANAPGDDTGRSQFDNVTKVNNPTIYLRLDDAIFLQDLPGNQTPGGVPPMGPIPIPFNPATTISTTTAGFRIAVYDGGNGVPAAGNPHTLDPNDSTFIGFAQPVAGVPHLYSLTIGSQGADSLADGLHHLTARVQIIDPANPTQSGFGDRSVSLDIVVDTAVPPAYFGLISLADTTQGLDPASDSGVLGDPNLPATFTDRITNDKTPTLYGTAEANAIVRVYSGHQRRARASVDRRQSRHVPGRDDGGAARRHEPVPQWPVVLDGDSRPERSVAGFGHRRLADVLRHGRRPGGQRDRRRQRRLAADLPRHAGTADHQRADHRLAGVQPVRAEAEQRRARPHPAGQLADDQRSGPAGAGGRLPLQRPGRGCPTAVSGRPTRATTCWWATPTA